MLSRLQGCAGCSAPLLFANHRRQVFMQKILQLKLVQALHAGKNFMVICYQLNLFENELFQNSFRHTIKVSNSLYPDLARHSVGTDLGTNCLQRLSADDWPVNGLREIISICHNFVYVLIL